MRILILGECSGRIRDAFIKLGHEAWSCDHKASEVPGPHFQMDFYDAMIGRYWDIIIAHPTCTALCVSGNSTYATGKPKHSERVSAASWTETLWDNMRKICDRCALENPVGVLPRLTKMGKPTQYVQPYEFGHPESKKTGLWISGLPKLIPTEIVEPEYFMKDGEVYRDSGGSRYSKTHYTPRYANQTASGQNKLGPSEDRATIRSRTYRGIADAIADQWSKENKD